MYNRNILWEEGLEHRTLVSESNCVSDLPMFFDWGFYSCSVKLECGGN